MKRRIIWVIGPISLHGCPWRGRSRADRRKEATSCYGLARVSFTIDLVKSLFFRQCVSTASANSKFLSESQISFQQFQQCLRSVHCNRLKPSVKLTGIFAHRASSRAL